VGAEASADDALASFLFKKIYKTADLYITEQIGIFDNCE